MYLIKHGFGVDVAFGCSPQFRLASVVTLAGFDGNEFDWDAMRFRDKDRG